MLQQLINHSPDLQKLRNEGYELQLKGGYLLIHHIPYVNSKKEVKLGTLVTVLEMNGSKASVPSNHVLYFIGEAPCLQDGTAMTAIINSIGNVNLLSDLTVNFTFSSRPAEGYIDYYHKVSTYTELLSAPAKSLDQAVSAYTHNLILDEDQDSVFHYYDTNSSRANIELINGKLKGQNIAIIGLGGTGSYILDLISKTPVSEIHVYDGDLFLQHNSFRAPGAAAAENFGEVKKTKVEYMASIYSNMHKKIRKHAYYLTDKNLNELASCSFVFICVDKNSARNMVIEYLLKSGISFIDVGMGVNVVEDKLIGMVRTTTGTASKNDHLYKRIPAEDDEDNEYNSNIQIAELNMYNAALAVLKWKKTLGFYHDTAQEHDSCFIIDQSKIINEDFTV